jgi:uncharacterized protein YbjT (DUF2867 family)
MPRTVLILGGSGLLGAPVARRFRAEGYAVRLLVRDEARARRLLGDGFQHVVGGVGSADALSAAVDGCTAVHVSLGGLSDPAEIDRVERRGTAEVARLAAAAGVSRLTFVSGAFVGDPTAGHRPAERAKLDAERAIDASGVPYTIFRPTYLHAGSQRLRRARGARRRDTRSGGLAVLRQGTRAAHAAAGFGIYCSALAPSARVMTVPLPVMVPAPSGPRGSRSLAVLTDVERRGAEWTFSVFSC